VREYHLAEEASSGSLQQILYQEGGDNQARFGQNRLSVFLPTASCLPPCFWRRRVGIEPT
jgi:hypothetical protein